MCSFFIKLNLHHYMAIIIFDKEMASKIPFSKVKSGIFAAFSSQKYLSRVSGHILATFSSQKYLFRGSRRAGLPRFLLTRAELQRSGRDEPAAGNFLQNISRRTA